MKILSSLIMSAVIASLALSAAPAPDTPKDLAAARKAYAGAVEKAVQPLRADYLRSLDRLLQDYTRAGKLEAAVAVKKEMVGAWLDGEWTLNGDRSVHFDREGHCSEGPWSIDGDSLVISVGADWKVVAPLPKTFSGAKKLEGQAFFRGKSDHAAVYVARN